MAPETQVSEKVTFEVMVIVEVAAGEWDDARVEESVRSLIGSGDVGMTVLEVTAR